MRVFYDGSDINKIVAYYTEDTSAAWVGMTELVDPDGSFTVSVDIRHHKIVGSTITEMSAGEKTARPLPDVILSGKVIPPMTTIQRDAMPTPPTGDMICNTTTGQIEFYGGSAWAAVGGGGGMWTSIQKQTISSGVSQVDFESGLTGKDAYKLVGSNIELDANADVRLRVKADGAYKTGGSHYEFSHHVIASGGPTSQQDATSAFIELSFAPARADADKRIDFEILFGDLSQVSFHNFMYRCAYMSSATNLQVTHGGGRYVNSDDIEGIRIYPSTGNIDNGVLELFGR